MSEHFAAGMPASLADLLTLHDCGGDRFSSRCNEANRGGDIFGGQYLGQAVAAALATAPGYAPQVMFAFFLRAALAEHPLDIAVERTRQGRRYAHRRVTISQSGKEVFRAEVALHKPEPNHPAHAAQMPVVPPPEELPKMLELVRRRADWLGDDVMERVTTLSTGEARPVDPEIGFGRAAAEPSFRVWIRGTVPADADPTLHYAGLAYLSDNFANLASRISHTGNIWDRSLAFLSLNHTIAFHALPRVQDWLLYDITSQFAGGAVGSNRNLIFGRDGQLVASVTQDAMVRRI